jgi:hypothetical protein
MARKMRIGETVCFECGEDLTPTSNHCHHCGTEVRTMTSSDHGVTSAKYIEDVPERASYAFWMDGLLFTSAWYIPVILIAITILSVLLYVFRDYGESLLAILLVVAVIILAAFLYRSDRHRNDP